MLLTQCLVHIRQNTCIHAVRVKNRTSDNDILKVSEEKRSASGGRKTS